MTPPRKLKENITNLFGERGKKWLDNLPAIIFELASYWQLSSINPIDNMTYHYVAKAIFQNQPVVLKIGCDKETINDEKKALNYFDGHASIKLIDSNDQYYALLLQQAIPGITLKSLYLNNIEWVMGCYVKTMQKLHDKPIPLMHSFRHIEDWLKAINQRAIDQIPKELLNKAIYLKNKLLSAPSKQFVLHGDLHHDNILKHDDDWLTIDPKGIVGEEEFEIAAFDFISDSELKSKQNVKDIFAKRCNLIASKSNLDSVRIREWVFVRLILSAIWFIEDNGDPGWAINLANIIA